ncbi:flagellar assembly protein FliW [Fictibacillus terranigra]|uniref:Flagellar assembly factor FliW n=1 Tax=Fictibacillus terranigra TaxID=3058424 RepID=A0ABT8E2A9_9BACL|nr:flagellar assembly protein FliW [Fictibacillus sp. CENA-BCM004]MDN4072027.1 flagellar assembly protein FliW [Fictibacillus sp. CENA-BCM004]
MELKTKFHGDIEVEKNDVITFEHGIPGFEEERGFVILPFEDTPFSVMQSVSTSGLAFVTADPFTYFPGYDFTLPESVVNGLAIKEQKDVFVQVIVTLREDLKESTANLQAPVIINKVESLGKQVVLIDNKYTSRHLIFASAAEKRGV